MNSDDTYYSILRQVRTQFGLSKINDFRIKVEDFIYGAWPYNDLDITCVHIQVQIKRHIQEAIT